MNFSININAKADRFFLVAYLVTSLLPTVVMFVPRVQHLSIGRLTLVAVFLVVLEHQHVVLSTAQMLRLLGK